LTFFETIRKGAVVIEPEKREDSRGFFARTFCQREFSEHSLDTKIAQCNVSFNAKKGTLRGMHYQIAPFAETKLVRCTAGAIFDVIIDLRPDSATFKNSFGIELSAKNHKALYVPRQFAHGFLTLENNTEVFYQMSQFYSPDHARGVRWNDPAFDIKWPLAPRTIAERDQTYPDFKATEF
jgi:dTDP-4-dehydrorhamnose 3,5-epimerase